LGESPAFLFCCCQRDSPALRPKALSKLCRITPLLLVLQGKDKCSNAHKDNGNLIHQHKSARVSLPKESYPDVLACPDRSTVPITHCATRDCLLPSPEPCRPHGRTPLPDSISRLSCSIPQNPAGRSKTHRGAGSRARLTALGFPLVPRAHLPPLSPGEDLEPRHCSPSTLRHPHAERSTPTQMLSGSPGFKTNRLHICLPKTRELSDCQGGTPPVPSKDRMHLA